MREPFLLSQSSASSSTLSQEIVNNWSIYAFPTEGIKIKYPENWEKQKIQDSVTKEMVRFLPPQETNSEQEKLSITVEDLSNKPLTLNEYTNLSINEIKQHTEEANIIDSRSATLANRPAHLVVYTSNKEPYSLKKMEIWTLKNNKAYIITYTAKENKYSQFLKTAKEMIKSFEIIGS